MTAAAVTFHMIQPISTFPAAHAPACAESESNSVHEEDSALIMLGTKWFQRFAAERHVYLATVLDIDSSLRFLAAATRGPVRRVGL